MQKAKEPLWLIFCSYEHKFAHSGLMLLFLLSATWLSISSDSNRKSHNQSEWTERIDDGTRRNTQESRVERNKQKKKQEEEEGKKTTKPSNNNYNERKEKKKRRRRKERKKQKEVKKKLSETIRQPRAWQSESQERTQAVRTQSVRVFSVDIGCSVHIQWDTV